MKKYIIVFIFSIICVFFFKDFVFFGKLPIPSDTIIGLYHPFRDLYSKDYPNGIPFKNFLITDPVRQQFPWRNLSVDLFKKGELPLWNPFVLSGSPLMANFQSAVFYPINFFFFLFSPGISWSILIFLEPLLAGIFMYLYLDDQKINKYSCFLGGIVFAFCGFSVSWMEWGTILHVALWLPLILLSIDKVFILTKEKKISIINPRLLAWSFVFVFSLTSSFFAGHLQTFFYVFVISFLYFFLKWIIHGKTRLAFLLFVTCYSVFVLITSIQWYSGFYFLSLSGRGMDQSWLKDGWFIPWQNLVQFIAPDFFGNPTTLNYWGSWNYGEFVGYIGILPLLLSVYALFFRRDRKTLFYGTLFFVSLIFSLPTVFAKLPYLFNIPFLSTAQPTRLIFVTDFSLAVLSALGLDLFFRNRKSFVYPTILFVISFIVLWIVVLLPNLDPVLSANFLIAKRNLFLPTGIFFVNIILLICFIFLFKKRILRILLTILLLLITIFDLFRFGWKFLPFTNSDYLFPSTKTISFLQNNSKLYRIMSVDSRIFPPNFSVVYGLQSIEGYDPLYLAKYAELIAASERGRADISYPLGFNRIIAPHNYDSKIIDLLGVKYVLSLSELKSPNLNRVFQEGQTFVYENTKVMPRAFFVENIKVVSSDKEAIEAMFQENLNNTAIVQDLLLEGSTFKSGQADIIDYSPNKVKIRTENTSESFLVLTDSFYPLWHAKIDDVETKIYRTDYNFRGVVVPKGKHLVEFYLSLF